MGQDASGNRASTDRSAVDAAILVVRTLVRAYGDGSSGDLDDARERARHCRLLASRLKLPLAEAHRISLAAWLSVLKRRREDLALQLCDEHGLGDILVAEGDEVGSAASASEILNLVTWYHTARKDAPELVSTPQRARKSLERLWAPRAGARRELVRKFVSILRDEAFLEGAERSGGQILIVDGEEAVVPVLAPPLRGEGYAVNVVPDADMALRLVEEFVPDVILADANLRVVDGVALCERLKQDAKTAHIPVFLTAAKRTKATERRALRAGAEALLPKPVDLEVLMVRLQRLMPAAAGGLPDRAVAAPVSRQAVAAGASAAPTEAGAGSGVTGSLNDLDFTDLIQIVCAGNRSLALTLEREGQTAEVFIRDGDVIHARLGEHTGETAFYDLLRWKDGRFATRRCDAFPDPTISVGVMSLLMEGARRLDEDG